MRRNRRWTIRLLLLACATSVPHVARAQAPFDASSLSAPAESLSINAQRAQTWMDDATSVITLEGPVTIDLDRARLSADRAVVWLSPVQGSVLEQYKVEIALIGNARLSQGDAVRTGDRLFVSNTVRGTVRVSAEERLPRNGSDDELYKTALTLRPIGAGDGTRSGDVLIQRPWMTTTPSTRPTTIPTTQAYRPSMPVNFSAADSQTAEIDGKVAFVFTGGVVLTQTSAAGDFIELRGERAVVFTQVKNLNEVGEASKFKTVNDAVEAAYLEGDIQVTLTPASTQKIPEQRLRAERIYYEFTNDRAVLTQAVLHTVEPGKQIPVVVRARTMRMLARGEYSAEKAELTTSSFALPSYSIRAERAYVRQVDTGDPNLGNRTSFTADDSTFRLYNVPVFYTPKAAGSLTDRGFPLRALQFGSSRGFGPGVRSEWGLFESLGIAPPKDNLDISYRLDYFSDRGPAGGIDGRYSGGYVTETTKDPWNFEGEFTGYVTHDAGEDRLGRDRLDVEPPDQLRGRVFWEHQHFFPQDWQVQLRAGYVSDPTFLEEWFESDFEEGQGQDVSIYAKRQRDTEALTLLVKVNPNDFVTTADLLQEQATVEKLPEVGYYRVGDGVLDDRFTFFSANTLSVLRFDPSSASLADQGFRADQSPGIPSFAQTGQPDDPTYRGDFRQELDFPFSTGQFKVVPYVFGRYTGYSDSPEDDSPQRLMAGTGVRMTTAFWRVDDSAESHLFDVHRVRHVVEPELHLFTSAATESPDELFIYDEPIDKSYDVSAAQVAIRQRWQTKRGGPGRWRSVDFFTLNLEGNFFANQPDDLFVNPQGFRGLFYASMPENSIPRNAIAADALWRVSDTTALLADANWNLDEQALATTSVGLAVQRDTRLSYFVGTRYIGQINSTIATIAANYELTTKYQLAFSQSFDLGERENQRSSFTLIRRFDRFFMTFTTYYDAVRSEGGFRLGLFPEGLGYGLSSDQVSSAGGR